MPPHTYLTRDSQLVTLIQGNWQVERHDFELSAALSSSATMRLIPTDLTDVRYVHRILLVADFGECWSRFRQVNTVSASPPESRAWLKFAEGVPRGEVVEPPSFLIQLNPNMELWVDLSAGVKVKSETFKRVAGLLLDWSVYQGDPHYGA
jgi:hypothetical protein